MSGGTSRTPAIVGFLVAGALLLIIGYAANRDGSTREPALPELRIVHPATGDTVANPVTLRFTTPADLRLTSQGWTADDLHVHLMLDGHEHMPAAADIAATDSTFVWRLPALPPGSHRAHLNWAARHHGNLAGPSDTATFVVRP